MGLYRELESYTNDSPLLRSPKFHCPLHRSIDASKATADANGNKVFPGGYFVSEGGANSMARIAPRATTRGLVTTSDTEIGVHNAMQFVAGDVLVIPVPYARLDMAGTWANDDVANVTIAGQLYSYTVQSFSTLTTTMALIAGYLNTLPALRGRVRAIAENQYIHLFSVDGQYHTVAASETTAGNGTLTVADSVTAMRANLSVGTIDTVDVANRIVNLASASARRIPLGCYIGTTDKVLGLLLRSIDLINEPGIQGLCTEAEIRADKIPYHDGNIVFTLPDLKVY